ncbi:MAG: hypothetical protein FWH26_02360 [Oscillospiraceae bacterium]|nr:hypothetical protein [Oscillospiraceae bacterium]
MKRTLTILLALLLGLAPLVGCGEREKNPEPAPLAVAPFAELRDNYAWAISNGDWETPGTHLAAVEYAGSPESLTLAVGWNQLFPLRYEGEKEATGENGEYGASYAGIAGHYWSVESILPVGWGSCLLLPASCEAGILALTPAVAGEDIVNGFYNHGHPPADPADVTEMEGRKNGRRVLHSELLATDENGGRVSLFQFESTDMGLLVLAYINGDRVIAQEFSNPVDEHGVIWRADAEEDDICVFEVTMLCETDAGLVLAYLWYGPEGTGKLLVAEDGGAFVELASDAWTYDHWENRYYRLTS